MPLDLPMQVDIDDTQPDGLDINKSRFNQEWLKNRCQSHEISFIEGMSKRDILIHRNYYRMNKAAACQSIVIQETAEQEAFKDLMKFAIVDKDIFNRSTANGSSQPQKTKVSSSERIVAPNDNLEPSELEQ